VISPVSGFLRIPFEQQTALGIPFQSPPVAAGRLTSTQGATLTDDSAQWIPQQWTRRPYVARVTSGGIERQFGITTSSANTLTLAAAPFAAPEPGDYYEIAPVHTLGGLIRREADMIQLTVNGRWHSFRREGALWRGASGTPANRQPLDPAAGLILFRNSGGPAEIILTGEVPSRPQQSEFFTPDLALVANRFPATMSLKDLQLTPTWRPSERANAADTARTWMDGRWRSFYFDGLHWRSPGSRAVWDKTAVSTGSAILFHRRGEAAPVTLTQDPP
jgi:hypothetical protein